MNKVALVEDNKDDIARFQMVFAEYCKNNNLPFELTVYENGADFISAYKKQFDLLFLDIELPDSNGIELAKSIRESGDSAVIVFLTNMAQFAIKGYEVDAIDFILKPLVPNIFMAKMKKFAAAVMSNQSSEINLLINNGKRVIRSSDIVYVEVIKHDLSFHTVNGVFTERCSLKEVESRLSKSHFSRPNYCYLVNLRYVVAIEKFDVILSTGDALQISRNRKKEFIDDFSRFLGGSF